MEAEPHSLNSPLPIGQVQAPAPGRGDHHSGFRAGREGIFSSLPSLLGRVRWNLYRKLSGQDTDFTLGLLFVGTEWGGNSNFTRVLLSYFKKSLQTFLSFA